MALTAGEASDKAASLQPGPIETKAATLVDENPGGEIPVDARQFPATLVAVGVAEAVGLTTAPPPDTSVAAKALDAHSDVVPIRRLSAALAFGRAGPEAPGK